MRWHRLHRLHHLRRGVDVLQERLLLLPVHLKGLNPWVQSGRRGNSGGFLYILAYLTYIQRGVGWVVIMALVGAERYLIVDGGGRGWNLFGIRL